MPNQEINDIIHDILCGLSYIVTESDIDKRYEEIKQIRQSLNLLKEIIEEKSLKFV